MTDEIVNRAQELLDRYREKNVECHEAEGRYSAILPLGQALERGQDLDAHRVDWEQAERLRQIAEQKREEKQKALRDFWEFREQHRAHLIERGFLK